MSELTCGFIGLGLIGGSIAKALRAAFPDVKIIAYDTNPETLSLAAREGIADVCAPGITSLFSECHYLFLCAPVSTMTGIWRNSKRSFPPAAFSRTWAA